jgi:hypothetical protein
LTAHNAAGPEPGGHVGGQIRPRLQGASPMTQHVSLQFLGRAQGLHLEARTFAELSAKVCAAIAHCADDYRGFVYRALASVPAAQKRGYASMSTEYGCWAFSWRPKEVEPFALDLTARCAEFGPFPGLDYSDRAHRAHRAHLLAA